MRYWMTRATRHGAGAVAEAALVALVASALVFALAAASGNNPGGAGKVLAGKAAPYSTLELASSTLKSASTSSLALGSPVLFTAHIYGLKGSENPQVRVTCYASDGTILYRELGDPDATFVLGGGTSLWTTLSPAPSATCESRLFAYTYRSIRELTDPSNPLRFHADG